MPSSATFVSHKAPLSALQHNPSSGNPNEGRIGINIDGTGGAEMIIVGGQDGANHYIEQISVFNLRSLKWTSTQPLGKSCGAYRSVVAPLSPSVNAQIGKSNITTSRQEGMGSEAKEPTSSMLIYSNYNFLDVKLELQIRGSDGTLVEKPMTGSYSPPGLRFPNGGVTDTHFVLLREGAATQDGSDAMTLRTGMSSQAGARMSTMTITQSNRNTGDSSLSLATSLGNSSSADPSTINSAPTPTSLSPSSRPRCLYLPHTYLTVQALLHFLYTSSLPPPSSPLCTPQILCSLLQIARPYKIDGLLEAVVERLHTLLDSRNAAAVFNATAMAAGGGRGIDGSMNPNFFFSLDSPIAASNGANSFGSRSQSISQSSVDESTRGMDGLRINTSVPINRPGSAELSASTSVSGSEWGSEVGDSERGVIKEVWTGELSSVIGLQKRGLRGLMEGRRMRATADRERDGGRQMGMGSRIGLGIAGS
ncbi:hypothetical protein ONZ43_g2781 [Nemania bipapillata]|uniref:Uncharacterized protein n=1 Tax=Nemania bipapillata TaxID=110536 RepID=A0ACC2IZ86_9PEZI|nr:hypothetical protein ONZ43_g2781 [Nemania bipapillata]